MTGAERDPQDGERSRGPGLWLRRTRERRQLGIPEVAIALHLERRTLEALEADDYGALPPATFVRGYLRAYARHLDLPEDDVLRSFDRLGLNRRRPLTTSVGTLDHRGGPGLGIGVPLLMGALAVLVFGGAWLLWTGQVSLPELPSDDATPAVAGAAAERPSPEPAPAPVEPAVAAVSEVEKGVTTSDESPQAAPSTTADEPAAENGVTQTGGEALAIERAPEAVAAPASERPDEAGSDGATATAVVAPAATDNGADEPPADPERIATASGSTEPEPTPEPAAAPSESLQTLSFTFTGESWMEVVDARGERLLFGLVTAPGERVVRGVPPFQIVIGNVGRVSLSRGGEPVALDSYTRGRVARFTLDER